MTGAEYIEEFLYAQGVRRIYEVSGGMIALLLDAVHRRDRIQLVGVRHEQAGALAADADARLTGVPGIAIATSGPGAVNLLTGIGSCYFDSTPAVFITGQVNRSEQRGDRPIRQLGFQETDIVTMAKPITKAALRVVDDDELPARLEEAFEIALSGRPGPVLLDVPMDVQARDLVSDAPRRVERAAPAPVEPAAVAEALELLGDAERPLVLAGGGIHQAGAEHEFRAFVERLGVPVTTTLLGLDLLPFEDPLRVGMHGTYGNRWTNLAIGESDAILVLGSRLDIRQTGADTDWFTESRTIHHVDLDPGELDGRVATQGRTLADLRSWLPAALESAGRFARDRSDWLGEIDELRREWPDTGELRDLDGINPNEFMHALSARSGRAAAWATDAGQHQMWVAQSIELREGQRLVTPGGMSPMGSGLPLALGTAFACGGRPVVNVVGDAGLQLNIQEFQTVVQHQLPIKLVILNNHCHGMVRQFQESYFDGRYPSTVWGYSVPDFVAVGEAFGLASARVETADDVDPGLEAMWRDEKQPFLLDVHIPLEANCYPKVAFGRPITEMEPFADPVQMGRVDGAGAADMEGT